ncbi:MAG: hypothetical protein AAB588_03130 [Patescibacteria group bacterium]
MINYKPRKFKKFSGDYRATITGITVEPNQYFKEDEDNSTENVLSIVFDLEDPETLEVIPFTQKFVAPLTGGNDLFSQLLDINGLMPDLEGGSLDEQELVGMKLIVTMGKNKKGYGTVEDVKARSIKKPVQEKESVEEEAPPPSIDDLPF